MEYCVLFFWGWASALSSFLRKKQNNRFLHWYKKAGRERNRKGWGEEKQIAGLAPTPGPGLADLNRGSVFLYKNWWGGRGLFVCYTMGGNRKRQTIGDAEGEGKEGWAMQIGINAMHS